MRLVAECNGRLAGNGGSLRDCTAEVCHWEVTEVTCRRSAGTRWNRRRNHDDRTAANSKRRRSLVRVEFVIRVRSSAMSGKNTYLPGGSKT